MEVLSNLRADRLLGGLQINNDVLGKYPGTLGLVVSVNGIYYGLTAAHVIFGSDLDRGEDGNIYQPYCIICAADLLIGNADLDGLIYSKILDYCLFPLGGRQIEYEQSINYFPEIIDNYSMPFLDQRLKKYGATTKDTYGIVVGVEGNRVYIAKDHQHPRSDEWKDISAPGDSGAVWINDFNEVVALHTSAENSELSIATSFDAIVQDIFDQFFDLEFIHNLYLY